MSKPLNVTGETFQSDVLESPIPVIVDFWAPWCGPCRVLGPRLDALAERHPDKVRVAKVNVDEERELASLFRVSGIPTMIAFKQGRAVGQVVGVVSDAALESIVDQLSALDLAAADREAAEARA